MFSRADMSCAPVVLIMYDLGSCPVHSIKQSAMTLWQLYVKNVERRSYVPLLPDAPQIESLFSI